MICVLVLIGAKFANRKLTLHTIHIPRLQVLQTHLEIPLGCSVSRAQIPVAHHGVAVVHVATEL